METKGSLDKIQGQTLRKTNEDTRLITQPHMRRKGKKMMQEGLTQEATILNKTKKEGEFVEDGGIESTSQQTSRLTNL